MTATLDPTQPIVLILAAILHFVLDDEQARAVVRALCDWLPQGSALILSHGTGDFTPAIAGKFDNADFTGRSRQQIAALLPAGWTILDPGLTVLTQWHPELRPPDGISLDVPDEQVGFYGVMLQKGPTTAAGPA